MIRRPPRSTLFPSRRSSDLRGRRRVAPARRRADRDAAHARAPLAPNPGGPVNGAVSNDRALARSEEHTSELQSLAYLVCRLLLEKKKTHDQQPRSTTHLAPS